MKKIHFISIFTILLIPICISSVYAQSLYVDVTISDMDDIEESKYKASAVSIVRNENGELVSLARVDATRYLNDPVIDEFLKSNPKMLIKTGTINNEKVSLYRTIAEYYNPQCLEKKFEVPGYDNECDWYHRAFVTMLGVTKDDTNEQFTIFRGLNHAFIVKSMYEVKTIWDIFSKD